MSLLKNTLTTYFGFSTFRPPQEEIMTSILQHQDTLAILPTGKGKSLCFQLPSLLLPALTLVISPLLALMQDQVDSLQGRGLPAAALTSDLSPAQRQTLLQTLPQNTLKFLYLSPEQLHNPRTKATLLTTRISHLCIDEAHCISQWGHNFRPEYRTVNKFLRAYVQKFPRPVLSAFTATASARVKQDILTYFPLTNPHTVILPYFRDNLDYTVLEIGSEAQKRSLWHKLLSFWHENHLGKFLVYVPTRIDAKFYTHWAQTRGFPAQAFHAGLSSTKRNELLQKFQTAPTGLLIATTAFGMGIDIPDIRFVVHLSPPTTLSAYAQESGRAGRDGKRSWCILFYQPQELENNLELFLSTDPQQRNYEKKEAYTLHQWATASPCYAQNLSHYFDLLGNWHPTSQQCFCSRCAPGLPWENRKRRATLLATCSA